MVPTFLWHKMDSVTTNSTAKSSNANTQHLHMDESCKKLQSTVTKPTTPVLTQPMKLSPTPTPKTAPKTASTILTDLQSTYSKSTSGNSKTETQSNNSDSPAFPFFSTKDIKTHFSFQLPNNVFNPKK